MIRTRSSNSIEPGNLSGEGRILSSDLEMDHAISTVGPSQLDGGFAGLQELRGGSFATHGRDPEARGRATRAFRAAMIRYAVFSAISSSQ